MTNRDNFDRAMLECIIKYYAKRLAMFGYTGSGKTHTLKMILGETLPLLRVSTACASTPVRAMNLTRIGVEGEEFKRIETEQFSDFVMKTAKDYINKSMPTGPIRGMRRLLRKAIHTPTNPTEEVERDLLTRFHKPDEDKNLLNGQTLAEMTDCGGQPQLLEILPRFLDGISLGILVTDLSQCFDDYPINCYYNEKGEPVGEGVRSTLTNE